MTRSRWTAGGLRLLAAGAVAGWPTSGAAQVGGLDPSQERGFPAWVALYDPADLSRLENENRIDELCSGAPIPDRCYAEALAPSVVVHPLRSGPAESEARSGELLVVAVPGRGLSAFYRLEGSETTVPFTPDLWLADWGYGPHFHQTISAREGDWFRLPRGPWPEEVWLERGAADETGSVIDIRAGDILDLEGSGFYVVSAEAETLVLRPEQPADMWCDASDPPAIVADAGARWTREELSDPRGHLRFTIRYPKGC